MPARMRCPTLLTVDHPRAGDREQPVEQQAGEGEVAEVVGAELQLEPVGGGARAGVYITPALLISRSIRS